MKIIFFVSLIYFLAFNELKTEPFKKINSFTFNIDNSKPTFLNKVVYIDGELFNYSTIVDSNCSVRLTSFERDMQYSIPIPQELKVKSYFNCGASLISDIVSRNDTLIFVFNHYLLLFKRNIGNFILSQILDLHDYFSTDLNFYRGKLMWKKNTIYCFKDNRSTRNPSFYLWSLDLTNFENKYFLELEEPNDFILSILQPKRIASINEKLFISSKLSEYKIYFYNDKYEICDSIYKSKKNWEYIGNKLDLDPNDDTKINACKILYHTANYFYLHFVDLINDKIMVCYSYLDSIDVQNDERFHFYYDIWELKDCDWKILYEDMDNNKMVDINGNKMKLENSYTIYNNKIYNFIIDYKNPEKSKLEVYQLDE